MAEPSDDRGGIRLEHLAVDLAYVGERDAIARLGAALYRLKGPVALGDLLQPLVDFRVLGLRDGPLDLQAFEIAKIEESAAPRRRA